jgi:hypothetical protein
MHTKATCAAPDVSGQKEPVLLLDVSTPQSPEQHLSCLLNRGLCCTLMDVSTPQGPQLHLDLREQEEPLLLLDLSTLQRPELHLDVPKLQEPDP